MVARGVRSREVRAFELRDRDVRAGHESTRGVRSRVVSALAARDSSRRADGAARARGWSEIVGTPRPERDRISVPGAMRSV